MKIYNTLSRSIEDFKPISDEVKVYSCGPTVYDYAQIGNLRAFIFADTLRRTLEFSNYKTRQVMNITDVGHLVSDEDDGEDKLEKGAKRESKTVWEVAQHYTKAFLDDAKQLNLLPPNAYHGKTDNYVRATDFIDQQIKMVETLVEKGFGYVTEQAIYFDVSKLSDYGKLTSQKLNEKETAARAEVITDPNKRHPQDFALWFFKVGRFSDHSMAWPSPWGDGFPGWHLECSAIIHATLGEPIDIHTGGVDHIGTHHTNEIAQTEAAFDKELSKYWMHNEFLLVNGKKMSKSLGNYLTLKDIVDKGFEPLALRLLFLQAHYRSQMNFTWDSLDAAQSFLKRLQAWADLKFQSLPKNSVGHSYNTAINHIKLALDNDLNTPEALGWLSGLASQSEQHGVDQSRLQDLLEQLDELFGLDLSSREDIDDEVKDLIAQREEARAKQNWEKSDEIRHRLLENKIELNDRQAATTWRRI